MRGKTIFTEKHKPFHRTRSPKKEVDEKIQDAVKENEEEQLDESIQKVKNVLFCSKTIFPLDLFPDEIVIDLERITIKKRSFFMSAEIKVYDITDVADCVVDLGPVSSTVRLILSHTREPQVTVRHISSHDALEMRRIIYGIKKAKKEHIDLIKINQDVLPEKINELGKVYA